MEAHLKRQIDDLIEYTISIKNMYGRIALWDIIPEKLNDEEQKDIDNIFLIINKALEIERKKIDALRIDSSDIEAIDAYLVGIYDDIECDDFLYENHLERVRIANRINAKVMDETLKYNTPIENKNIVNAVYRAIGNNYIYATDYEVRKSKDNIGFSYLKYAQIFLSSSYDYDFFPSCCIKPIVHYSHFRELMQTPTENEIKEIALKIIESEFMEIINSLYNGFTNEKIEDQAVFDRVMHNLMLINAGLISTLDSTYIDSAYLKFKNMRKEDPKYSRVTDYIQGVLVRSKKQILTYNNKKDSKKL